MFIAVYPHNYTHIQVYDSVRLYGFIICCNHNYPQHIGYVVPIIDLQGGPPPTILLFITPIVWRFPKIWVPPNHLF